MREERCLHQREAWTQSHPDRVRSTSEASEVVAAGREEVRRERPAKHRISSSLPERGKTAPGLEQGSDVIQSVASQAPTVCFAKVRWGRGKDGCRDLGSGGVLVRGIAGPCGIGLWGGGLALSLGCEHEGV